jgi:ribonuclease HI
LVIDLKPLQSISGIPKLHEALQIIKCLRTVLQWIPSHCGIEGNEEANRMAKLGAEDEQEKTASV